MSPKSLLRHPEAVSHISELAEGSFQRILPDNEVVGGMKVRRVLLTSGKLYYELLATRRDLKRDDVAIVRVEQYYPLDEALLEATLSPYGNDVEVLWVQEEPRNMGAWPFLQLHVGHSLFGRWGLTCVARPYSASPATGSASAHKKEQEDLIAEAFDLKQ